MVGYPSTSIAVNIRYQICPPTICGMFHPRERPGRLPFHPQPAEFNLPQRVEEPKHGRKRTDPHNPTNHHMECHKSFFPSPCILSIYSYKGYIKYPNECVCKPATGQLSCFTLWWSESWFSNASKNWNNVQSLKDKIKLTSTVTLKPSLTNVCMRFNGPLMCSNNIEARKSESLN